MPGVFHGSLRRDRCSPGTVCIAVRCLLLTPLLLAALLLAPAFEAHAASTATLEQLTIADRAMRLAITSGTDRYPKQLRKSCVADSRIVVRCRATWHDARYSYAGRFYVIDDSEAVSAVFAGLRTDRRCAAARRGAALKACRDAVSF
jgi:hypothetical protein